jgi:hypothetical protein
MSTHPTFAPEDHERSDHSDRTARAFFLAPVVLAPVEPRQREDEDRTAVEPIAESGSTYLVGDSSEHAVFTADMVEDLRRRLRDAEARESSGVRLLATGEEASLDTLAERELEIDVELVDPPGLENLEGVMGALPELEVALAPHSESNFYAGFDDEHPDGVFLATYAQVAVGAPVYVSVHLPGGYRFRCAAMVEWSRTSEAAEPGLPAGLGLSMCGLDVATRRLIRTFVRRRKPMFYVG